MYFVRFESSVLSLFALLLPFRARAETKDLSLRVLLDTQREWMLCEESRCCLIGAADENRQWARMQGVDGDRWVKERRKLRRVRCSPAPIDLIKAKQKKQANKHLKPHLLSLQQPPEFSNLPTLNSLS